MREAKMLTEKVIFIIIFFWSGLRRRMIHEVKRTCFCFPKTVICYLLSEPQNRFWKLSTVNCNAWELMILICSPVSSPCFMVAS